MKIQITTVKDIVEVKELVLKVSEKSVLPCFSDQGKHHFRTHVLADLETSIKEEHFLTLKAVDQGQIIGFAALKQASHLMYLFVAESHQGTGLGRALLDELLQHTDAEAISLRSSLNAVEFYQHYGFVATGEEAEFNGIRFVPMTLDLS